MHAKITNGSIRFCIKLATYHNVKRNSSLELGLVVWDCHCSLDLRRLRHEGCKQACFSLESSLPANLVRPVSK